MQKHGVSAVILAAGLSTRFGGSHKALRDLAGKTFMERMIEAFKTGGVHDIIVVTGHQADECEVLAARLGAKTAYNANFTEGMFSSIQTGFKAVLDCLPQSRAVLLSPVDTALLMPRSVAAMLEIWRHQQAGPHSERILVASMGGRPGHPALIPVSHLPAVLKRPSTGEPEQNQSPDTPWGLRGYYHALIKCSGMSREENRVNFMRLEEDAASGQRVIKVPLPDAGVLSDLDTSEDSSSAKNFLNLTDNRTLPSVEEAWQLLRLSDLNAKKMRHSILVAKGGIRIGLKMLEKGLPANPLLYITAGLLHDLMRLKSDHAVIAAEFLNKLGWPKTAFIVGCHTQLPEAYFTRLGIHTDDKKFRTMAIPPEAEREPALSDELFYGTLAVYMADKYARRDHLSGIDQRFADIRDWFRDNPAAIEGIDGRERVVKELEKWLGELLGRDLLELVSTPSWHPLEAALDGAIDEAY